MCPVNIRNLIVECGSSNLPPKIDIALEIDVAPKIDVALEIDVAPEIDVALKIDVAPEIDLALSPERWPFFTVLALSLRPTVRRIVLYSLSPDPEPSLPLDTRLIWLGRPELIYQKYIAKKEA